MRQTTKWAKVLYIFLVISLVVVSASIGPGKKGRKHGTPMDMIATWDSGTSGCQEFKGNTRDWGPPELCPGTLFPPVKSKKQVGAVYDTFGQCFEPEQLELWTGTMDVKSADITLYRDKETGNVLIFLTQ